jgi:cytoskeletal protein CcmA (bactofilin family)
MVKNLPSVERSTQIRFGKNVPDATEQAENTVIFNASNDTVPTPYSNAVYLSPIRNRTDYQAPEIVLLMYDRNTKEITESGESANALIGGSTLDTVTNRNNATSNTVQFVGPLNDVSFVTDSNIGISNLLPQHTVSVGSNLYIDDVGSNVLVVSGNVAVLKDMIIEGNLRVNGDTTVIYTENTSIKDALIELGTNNGASDTTLDLGILMHRPDALSNVVIGYREGTDEFALAYTDAKPTDKTFTPKTDEDINVHVYGLTHVDANIYAHEDVLVDGNVYVSQNVSITEELTISNNVYADKDLEVIGNVYVDGNVVAYKDFTLTGNAYVSGNVVASKDFTLFGNAYVSGNVNVTKQLSVSGNAYVSGNVEVTESLIVSANTHLKGDNVFITHTMDFLDPTTAIVTDQISNVQIRLGQLENVANTASNPLINQVLAYDQDNSEWSNAYPDQTIVQVKNTSGAPMTRGQAVHVTGSNGNNMFEVELADASDASKMPAIGIVYENIPINGEGAVVTFGRANGISGISGFTNGDTLYVASGTPGGLTNVKPYGVDLDLIQNVGVVVNHNSGVMFVTGIGRSNDIPNARIITDYNDMQYVYVNSENNDLKKITSANLNIPLTTAVSSSSNSAANAVTLRGVSITSGDGFHGDLVVAGNVTVDSTTLHVDAETNRVGLGTTRPGQLLDVRGAANVGVLTATSGTVTDATHSTSKDTGVIVVTRGGLGVEANIHSTNVFAASHIAVGTSATSNTFDVRGTANVGALVATSTHISDATESTSTTTGALQVTGGVGIQKDLYARDGHFSTDVSVGSLTNKKIPYANASKILTDSQISQETDGTVVISNDVEISGSLLVQGESFEVSSGQLIVQDRIIDIANNNPDHDLDIGILMEHPGHNIGLIHHPEDYFSMGYTQNGYSDTHILRDYSNEFTLNVWGYVTTQNTVTIEHNDLYVKDGLIGVNTDSPLADLHVVGNAYVTSNLQIGGDADLYVDTTLNSVGVGTNAPVATLDVRGNVYMSSNLAVNGTDLYVDTTLNRVGIRTQSPGYNLDVRGTANVGTLTATSGTVTDATPSSSKDTGVLVLTQGGLGVEANIHSTNVFAVSHIGVGVTDGSTTKALDVRGTANVGAFTTTSVEITDATTSTDQNSGALIVQNGGVGIEENLNVGGVTKVWDATDATTTTSGALQVVGGLGVAKTVFAADLSSGSVDVTDATGSISTTTGALTVGGGVGIVENLFVGGTGKIENATDATTTTSGALQVVGGLGVAKTVFAADLSSGSVDVTDATGSTSTATGALTVGGGVGIAENLFVGGTGKIEDATDATTTTSGALQVVGGLGVAKTVFAADLSSGSVDVTDATGSTSTATGSLTVGGGVGIVENLFVGGTGKIEDATDATTTTSGALQVVGGLGVAKTVFAADLSSGSVDVTDTTEATSTTTGALTVAGGISTQTNVHAANVYISGGLITNTAGVTKKTYAYSGTIGNTEQPYINVCFTNESFSAKITGQLIEGDDEISTITVDCCGGNKNGGATLSVSDIQTGSIQVFGPASTNPWSSTIVTDKKTVALRPSGAIDTSGEYHLFVEYITAKSAGAVANVVQDTTQKIAFGY